MSGEKVERNEHAFLAGSSSSWLHGSKRAAIGHMLGGIHTNVQMQLMLELRESSFALLQAVLVLFVVLELLTMVLHLSDGSQHHTQPELCACFIAKDEDWRC